MVGVVIVTHGNLAKELITAVNFVVSSQTSLKMEPVSLDPTQDFESLKEKIKKAIDKVDDGGGILIVTDMFGGTPSNVGLTFLEDNKIEVISGANLPMLLKLATLSDNHSLKEIVKRAESAGKDNIIIATKLLKKKSTNKS